MLTSILSSIVTWIAALVWQVISWSISLVRYVINGLAQYRIASRRGLKYPWLAWVPIGKFYVLGQISDQYRTTVLGKKSNRRKQLLALALIPKVGSVVGNALYGIVEAVVVFGTTVLTLMLTYLSLDTDVVALLMIGLIIMAVLTLLVTVSAILWNLAMYGIRIYRIVLKYMSLYDLYASCTPKSKDLFMAVGIIGDCVTNLPASAIVQLFCMNKDDGMVPVVTAEEIPTSGDEA